MLAVKNVNLQLCSSSAGKKIWYEVAKSIWNWEVKNRRGNPVNHMSSCLPFGHSLIIQIYNILHRTPEQARLLFWLSGRKNLEVHDTFMLHLCTNVLPTDCSRQTVTVSCVRRLAIFYLFLIMKKNNDRIYLLCHRAPLLMHWQTCSFVTMNTHSVDYFDIKPTYTVLLPQIDHQMWINLRLNKLIISFCLSTYSEQLL